jgi:uncharacterized protein
MKVKLFTHTDLDGIGCAVVAKSAFPNAEVSYCDYDDINEKIIDFLENEKVTDYDRIFITDISVNSEVAERLDLIFRGGVSGVQLVDHHGTALWLAEKYPMWAHVRVEESNMFRHLEPIEGSSREKVMSSGTSLFYKFLRNKHIPNIERDEKLKAFVEVVRRYDCWEWFNVYKNDHPKRLNDLLYIIGREKFVERFVSSPMPTFTDIEHTLLEVEQHRVNKYIWKKKRELKFANINVGEKPFRIAYVFAEQYGSLLGNSIADQYKDEIDFAVIIDVSTDSVSLRGVHDHIDLGKEVARYYGQYHNTTGGGHAKSAGFRFNNEFASQLFLKTFGMEE